MLCNCLPVLVLLVLISMAGVSAFLHFCQNLDSSIISPSPTSAFKSALWFYCLVSPQPSSLGIWIKVGSETHSSARAHIQLPLLTTQSSQLPPHPPLKLLQQAPPMAFFGQIQRTLFRFLSFWVFYPDLTLLNPLSFLKCLSSLLPLSSGLSSQSPYPGPVSPLSP